MKISANVVHRTTDTRETWVIVRISIDAPLPRPIEIRLPLELAYAFAEELDRLNTLDAVVKRGVLLPVLNAEELP